MKNQTHYTRRDFVKVVGAAIPMAGLPGIAFAAEATKSLRIGITTGIAGDNDALRHSFIAPPSSSAPQTWWHWMDGNITKEGITADLEAMNRIGLGGATILDVSYTVPAGKVKTLSPEWYELVQHAVRESALLGLKIGIQNCPGYSSSGGPWVTPEHSMMNVVTSEKRFKGPLHISEVLPQPPIALEFYRDIAVLAFQTPAAEQIKMSDLAPRITSSADGFDVGRITDGNKETTSTLPIPSKEKPQYIQFEFAQPYIARTVVIVPGGWQFLAGGEIQVSDDGKAFHTIKSFIFPNGFPNGETLYATIVPPPSRFYRILFDSFHNDLTPSDTITPLPIAEIDLRSTQMLDDFRGKADYVRGFQQSSALTYPKAVAVDKGMILNLTDRMDTSGKLNWNAPEGEWTIMRIGYTPTGALNHPASAEGTGPECDKLSREALKQFWDDGMISKVIAQSGPLAGKTLNHALIDSYEVGSQNWTPAFREEFKKRCGYDLLPYLPTLTGRFVGSSEESERFLWDYRRTIAELFAANYYDYMSELTHQSGLLLSTETYGDGPFDELLSGRNADMPMGEFWVPDLPGRDLKSPASVAHVYGKQLTGAEAFTSTTENGRWQQSPELLKPVGDTAFVYGINQLIFHRYALQPWLNRWPGMTMGPWGSNLERTNTWWEQGKAWITYLTRCQHLLRQGHFVADILYFTGEGSPNGSGSPDVSGYDTDICNVDVILNRLSVQNGRLILPDGMSYRLLVLSKETEMTPTLLKKIKELADAGATIIGAKPVKSPSLVGYPQCDEEVKTLADALWDSGTIKDTTVEKALQELRLPPDFKCEEETSGLKYIHRTTKDTEIYFIINPSGVYAEQEGIFRVEGKAPELWNPVTGQIQKAGVYEHRDGLTRIPLRMEPADSVFVVFPKNSKPGDNIVSLNRKQAGNTKANLLEISHATYDPVKGGGSSDVTERVSALVKRGSLRLVVSADLFGDPFPMREKKLTVDYKLNGKQGTATVPERGEIFIAAEIPQNLFPEARLTYNKKDKLSLEAWAAGTYECQAASGKKTFITVDVSAPSVQIDGPWRLQFQPERGAPPEVTLDQLKSWTEHSDSGVKYFSGTGTYTKTFKVAADFLKPERRFYLDLGKVSILAEVKLNGKDLGILWKRPFLTDITGTLRAGINQLEVKVTNLWVNRLIGDEQLPPDVEWKDIPWEPFGKALKEWPEWVLNNKPSPTGRITFTTWHTWEKNDPLLESGLIGPVRIWSSVEMPVELNP
jgi:hypothetical protein